MSSLHSPVDTTRPQYVTFHSIASALVARFILDLRTAYYHDSAPDQTILSIQLMAHGGGDLAAPLGSDSTWVTGQSDDLGGGLEDIDTILHSFSAAEQFVCESGRGPMS